MARIGSAFARCPPLFSSTWSLRVANRRVVGVLLLTALASLCQTRRMGAQASSGRADADSGAIALVVERFHAGIAAGDSAAVAALLAPGAMILESGDLETRAAYLRGHLAADIAFARAVRSTRNVVKLARRGDAAWVASTSRAAGTFENHPVDSEGAELMVLTRSTQGWRIEAIHWSSHRHRP
jgi:ketosteroid isomerase-like protein